MKKIWALILVLALAVAACDTTPEIIPDITGDSVIMLDIKSQIEHNKTVKDDYGWVIWYLPILFLVVAWGWKEFFGKKRERE
jgi:cytochrome bd-type quinol oxidase subunit 2